MYVVVIGNMVRIVGPMTRIDAETYVETGEERWKNYSMNIVRLSPAPGWLTNPHMTGECGIWEAHSDSDHAQV